MVEGDLLTSSKRNSRNNNEIWKHDRQFREYAILVGRKGKEALESIDNYPGRIELDTSWHKVLDSMRSETQNDQNERFTLVGYSKSSRDFYFSEKSGVGEPYTVSPQIITEMIRTAKDEHGVTSVLGNIHTHNYVGPLTFPDLYGFLQPAGSASRFINGLANPDENLFAFKTCETYKVSDFGIPEYGTLDGFRKYWMRKAGFKATDKPHRITRVVPSADMYAANIAIAQAHRLALYRGKPGQDLIRMFP